MKKESLEWKVGLFVFLALVSLTMLVVRAGDFYLKPGYSIRLVFNHVQGIDKGSPVKLAGVNVGELTSISAVRNEIGETKVETVARIHQGVYIENDAEVRINSTGMLGEKYVEILPGTAGSQTASEGSVLVGMPPVGMEKITESGSRLLDKLQVTADSINSVVTDPEFKSSVKNTFSKASNTFGHAEVVAKNLMEATEDIKDAAKSARIILARLRDGEGTVGRLLKEDVIAKDLEAFVKEIKEHPWKLLKRE
ncbi:MAG: hypothetical protein A3C47_05030 [Omnitrophica bacterium RIFCSPHIGHO2_02_FULL_51_18]|nr:MAG: hypothetical protein A3C47_05030 [Omnitrophica bacterium RIFCSPHIGHO2_02_FULL_51_18]